MDQQVTAQITASSLMQAPPQGKPQGAKIREAVVRLFAAYPAAGSAEATESAIGTYAAILLEYPLDAIYESAKLFLSGRVPGYNPAFRPSVAQWAAEARRLRDEARAKALPPKALPPPERAISAEERARVAEMMKRLAHQLAAKNREVAPARHHHLAPEDELAMLRDKPLAVSRGLIEKLKSKHAENEIE